MTKEATMFLLLVVAASSTELVQRWYNPVLPLDVIIGFKKEQPQKHYQGTKKSQEYSEELKRQKRPRYASNSYENILNCRLEEVSHASKLQTTMEQIEQ